MKQTRLQRGIIALMLSITLTACNNDDDKLHYNTDCNLTGQVYIPAESKYLNNDHVYGADKIEIEEVSRNGNLLTVKTLFYGNPEMPHSITLVHCWEVNTPNYYAIYHKAYGDTLGEACKATMIFDLSNTYSSNTSVTIDWKSYEGKKSIRIE